MGRLAALARFQCCITDGAMFSGDLFKRNFLKNENMKTQILTDEQFNSPENQNRDKAIIGYRSIGNKTKPLPIADISSRFNLVWDTDTNCENDFRSELLGRPIYDMKCNKCLSFVGAYHSPEDCEVKHCSNCGQEIRWS